MFRSIPIVLAVALACSVSVGCGGGNEATPPKKPADPPKEEPTLRGGKGAGKAPADAPTAAD
jgi:hypothetical protein